MREDDRIILLRSEEYKTFIHGVGEEHISTTVGIDERHGFRPVSSVSKSRPTASFQMTNLASLYV